MTDVKTSYRVGAATAKRTDPTGDNLPANFVRGYAMYWDKDVREHSRRNIEADKAALKQYLLSK